MLKFKLRVWLAMPLLAASLALAGCASSNSPTLTISTDSAVATAPEVCLVWKDIPYHGKTDNPDTIERIIANNAARDAYCAPPKH